MRRAPVIELNAEELTELQRTARSSRSSVREVFRARIVLLAAQGQENRAIAEQMDTRPDTVSKWRRRFAEQRMAGLIGPTRTRTKTSLRGEKSSNASSMTPCITAPSRPRIGPPAPWPGTRG